MAQKETGQLELVHDEQPFNLAEHRAAFGICVDAPITNADARLHAWALAASAGTNMLRSGDVLYSWDARPRRQKNGALAGRVYSKRRAEVARDIGAYKIDATGAVLEIPSALRGLLPGAEGAGESADAPGEEAAS